MVIFRHVAFDTLASPGYGMRYLGDLKVFPWTLFSATWMGVNLFFVDSGFVLYLPFAMGKREVRSLADVTSLYRRRAWRLLPLYYVMLAFAVALDLTWLHHMRRPWLEVPAYVTFVFPFFRETWQPRPNGTLWSIGVEVWFSLAFPLLVLLVRRIGMARFLLLAIVIALGTRTLAYDHGLGTQKTKTLNTLADSLLGRIDNFALGMAAAELFASRRTGTPRVGANTTALVALVLFATSAWLYDRDLAFGPLSTRVAVGAYALANAAFFLALLAGLRSKGNLRRLLSLPPLRAAGIRCYSLYLVHAPLAWLLYRAESMAPSGLPSRLALISTYLAVVALFSALTYRWVELPGIARGRAPPSGPGR